jgi:uncharacterized membrane protein YdjX (TVP38/TMEM64 family)
MRPLVVRLGVLAATISIGLALVATLGLPSRAEAVMFLGERMPVSVMLAVLTGGALGVLMFPRAALAALAGLLFGPVIGTCCALAAQVLGATLAFAIGRSLGQDAIGRLAGDRARRASCALGRLGVLGVAWARFVPLMPYALLNYGFGVTEVRVRSFVIGTALGVLPSTVAYAVVGDSTGDLLSPASLTATGFTVATAAAGMIVARHRRAAAAGSPATH